MGKEKKSNNLFSVSGDVFLDTAFSLNEIFYPKERNKKYINNTEIRKIINDSEVRIICPYTLSSPELRVYLALMAICCDFNVSYEVESDIKDQHYIRLRENVYIKGNDNQATLIGAECYLADILRIAGLQTGGAQYELLEEILLRLYMTTIIIKDKSKTTPMRLLNFDIFDKEKKGKSKISFILNSRSSDIIFGTDSVGNKIKRRYISMHDFLKLEESQYFVFVFISWWVFEGNTQNIYIDTLCEKIYSGFDKLAGSTKRSHRSKIANDLTKINSLDGWNVTLSGKGRNLKATITREKSSDRRKRLKLLKVPNNTV